MSFVYALWGSLCMTFSWGMNVCDLPKNECNGNGGGVGFVGLEFCGGFGGSLKDGFLSFFFSIDFGLDFGLGEFVCFVWLFFVSRSFSFVKGKVMCFGLLCFVFVCRLYLVSLLGERGDDAIE
jgi:hypothetical protein